MGATAGTGPMVSQLVVDTTAFYRLSLAELEAIAARAAVLVSPLSLCEVLSRIDEPRRRGEGSGGAATVRGDRIRKCDVLQTLADPNAERAPFADLAESIDELRDGKPLGGAAELAQRALGEARREYARRALRFREDLVARLGGRDARGLSGPEFVRLAVAGVEELAEEIRGIGADEPGLEGEVFSAVYPAAGYRLARALEQIGRAGSARDPQPDPQDMEEEHLCHHLDLLEPRGLLTESPAARLAMDRALAALAAAAAEVDAEVVALTRAMSVDDAVRALAG